MKNFNLFVSSCRISAKRAITAAALAMPMLWAANSAFAGTVTLDVDSHSGPWDQSINPTLDYGTHDNNGPAAVGVTAGQDVTITYLSGLTSAFANNAPDVDAMGYVGGAYGSFGPGNSGTGSSGTRFPSYYADPATYPIYLEALIGAFASSTGVVIGTPFAPGDGPYTIAAPVGATQLLLGFNDDLFSDNSGSLSIQVSSAAVSAVPLPAALPMFGAAVAGVAGLARRRRVKAA